MTTPIQTYLRHSHSVLVDRKTHWVNHAHGVRNLENYAHSHDIEAGGMTRTLALNLVLADAREVSVNDLRKRRG